MKTKWKLTPVPYKNKNTGQELFENCLIREFDGHEYPLALLHIDAFYESHQTEEDRKIYETLNNGEEAIVEVTLKVVEE